MTIIDFLKGVQLSIVVILNFLSIKLIQLLVKNCIQILLAFSSISGKKGDMQNQNPMAVSDFWPSLPAWEVKWEKLYF